MSEQKPKLKKVIGLRNIVTDGNQWKYLLFYDLDNPPLGNIEVVHSWMETFGISYIIYKTKNGIHAVGLRPLSIAQYAGMFKCLQEDIPEYYSGQTIRLSRKEGETQELLFYNLNYRPIILNLFNIYEKRFTQLKQWFNERQQKLLVESIFIGNWRLVFEKFWTSKV